MLSQKAAARACGLSVATIRRARVAGKLPNGNGGYLIPIPDLVGRWTDGQGVTGFPTERLAEAAMMTQIWRAFGHNVALLAVVSPLFVGCFIWLRYRRRHGVQAAVFRTLLVASLTGVVALTLRPSLGTPSHVFELIPFTGLDSDAQKAQILANFVLMMPTGAFTALAYSHVRIGRLIPLLVALPLVIEVAQFVLPIGRVCATEDMLVGAASISTGALLGRLLGSRSEGL